MRPELVATPLKVDAAATVVAASTTLTGAHSLPEGTLTVASTAGFLPEGALLLGGQVVEYLGKTATTFLGCTGGDGTVANGAAVAQFGGVRYAWQAVDVDTAGRYRGWFEITLPSALPQDTPEFDVLIDEHAPLTRPLCAIADVVRYVPAYSSDAQSDELLETLIAAESRSIHQTFGREFVAIVGQNPRLFDLTPWNVRQRRVRIGDAAAVTQVRVLDEDGTLWQLVAAADWHALPRAREEWEPIRQIRLREKSANPATFSAGQVLEVTGTWGFPVVPEDVRQACAKLVIVRYMSDTDLRGTRFASAVEDSDIFIPGLLRSAGEALRGYGGPPFA